MVQTDAIWTAARRDLTISTKRGGSDVQLWEEAARVTRCALQIARHEAVAPRGPNELLLTIVGLYRNAAWVDYVRTGAVKPSDILAVPPPPDHRKRGATAMKRCLRGAVPQRVLDRAAAMIQKLGFRSIKSVDVQVVADAEQLDGFGLSSVFSSIRKGVAEGSGIEALFRRWQRRQEYQFWKRRLEGSFHLEPVRKLAGQRLARLEAFMTQLQAEYDGLDIFD